MINRVTDRTGGGRWLVVAAAAGALALALATLAPTAGDASSHREAPLTSADPQVDNTDVYAFVSPDEPNTVTFVSNWIPFEEPAGGPNFYAFAEGVRYDINISNDGDARRRDHLPLDVPRPLPEPATRSSTTRGR